VKEWKNKSVKTRHATVVWLATLICLAGIRGACAQERAEVTPKAPGGIRDNRGADAGGYRIAGVVVDAATGVTIAGAELSIAEGIADVEVTTQAVTHASRSTSRYPARKKEPRVVQGCLLGAYSSLCLRLLCPGDWGVLGDGVSRPDRPIRQYIARTGKSHV